MSLAANQVGRIEAGPVCLCFIEITPTTCPKHGAFPGGELYNDTPVRAAWSPKPHDPVPDGRSGPFMRLPHLRVPTERPSDPQVLAHDERCSTCNPKES